MERDDGDKTRDVGTMDDIESRCAVNSLILDYYKKFGRKRDLEQYFSLSTAQSDIKDTSGLFWRKMKSENDSSDSGGRKSDSSHEVCRISIRCSLPEPSSSQDEDPKTKTESPHTESPPIIIEEVPADISRHTDDESINFDDNHSQKSLDALLDLSTHKPLSPTSSITSQRKLEWDSLADVGYANETDRKNSASSLSTLERLALKQQYSNNDSKQDIGAPTSQSTPIEDNDKSKIKKGLGKKTTKIYKKDVDFVEVNVPHTSDTNPAPSINVNLTKTISFNLEKDGGITLDNVKRDLSISPEKVLVEAATAVTPYLGMDKEIQTSLTKEKPKEDKSSSMDETPKAINPYNQKIPVMISLNTLRKRLRRKKSRVVRRKLRTKKKVQAYTEVTAQEKSGEQLSEAESFEYMPGHMYNQNQMKDHETRPDNSTAGNKSSLESSGALTTDSSKGSKHSLTKDLEKCIEVLKVTLQKRYDDGDTKKKLIKDIVHRLVNSKYRDDETTTEFLSGLTYSSKKLGIKDNTTTSTSDANTDDSVNKKPKSILRNDKFNPNVVASTSQSAPNLFNVSNDKLNTTLMKTINSLTESDASSRGKTSSENPFPKTLSEELYLKYLEALKREQAYKRHLKEKEMFLKQKLVSSETAFKAPVYQDAKINSRLKDLMKDLTRNNYDDGSGDASKLEGASSSNIQLERLNALRSQRSHSVFTLSSSHSECQKRPNLKKKMQAERELDEAGPSKNHYCCCPHHYLNSKLDYGDSSAQVNIKCQCEGESNNEKPSQTKPKGCTIMPCESKKCKQESPRNTRVVPDQVTGEIKYVCLCNGKRVSTSDVDDNFMIYKCSRLTNRGVQLEDPTRIYNTAIQCNSCRTYRDDKIELIQSPCKITTTDSSSSGHTSKARRYSKSSQANLAIKMCYGDLDNPNFSGSEGLHLCGTSTKCVLGSPNQKKSLTVHEATRCLQTEISINPNIADPTLSDINIINDCDCAKLVAEHFRKVYESSSGKSERPKTFSDVSTNSTSDKLVINSVDTSAKEESKSTMSSNAGKEMLNTQSIVTTGNEYTLPIQGTNMTLTVNLGGVDIAKKAELINQAVVTDKITHVDEAISVFGESTKSTQCSCSRPFENNIKKLTSKSIALTKYDNTITKKTTTDKVAKSSTYPKKEMPKGKTPFKRANTDTNVLSVCTCTQTDCLNTKTQRDCLNTNTQTDSIKTKSSESNKSNENQSKYEVTTSDNVSQVDEINENTTQRKEHEFIDLTRIGPPPSPKTLNSFRREQKNVAIQKDLSDCDSQIRNNKFESKTVDIETNRIVTKNVACETETETNKKEEGLSVCCQTDILRETIQQEDPKTSSSESGRKTTPQDCCSKISCPQSSSKDPIISMIQDITRRYSKKEMVKIKSKKCFTEVMAVLNYLLETEDSTDPEQQPKLCCSTTTATKSSSSKSKKLKISDGDCCADKQVDKGVQLPKKSCKNNKVCTESSDLPCSSDLPTTSSESAACKILHKIKKECEKYHQKKCKGGRKCEASSSTSVNCDKCKKVHYCACRNHKCKRSKTLEKLQKKCIAYNLIIQTSESMLSEETVYEKKNRPLKNIIVKVPKRKDCKKDKTERESPRCSLRCSPRCSPRCSRNRSRSCPNESETSDEYARRIELATVREYLEQNRPDFVQKTSERQNCLKFISERRASERSAHRHLLSLHVDQQPDLTKLSSDELRQLAKDIGLDLRNRKSAPKFISEREMKKHSENIYKTLPEVVQKKEEKKKENIKKTNLLMANIFKKNLQKQALRGSVNLSNYNTVLKI